MAEVRQPIVAAALIYTKRGRRNFLLLCLTNRRKFVKYKTKLYGLNGLDIV